MRRPFFSCKIYLTYNLQFKEYFGKKQKGRDERMKRKPRILVAGSFVMDQIASTEVFPGEGETVLGRSFQKAPGGKGANQAVQAARLGAEVTMFGKLGRDANGEEMLETCRKAGIHTEDVLFDPVLASCCSVIILEEKPGESTKNRIIVISGSNMSITKTEAESLRDKIRNYDLLMLQLEIPMEINEYLAEMAFENGVPVMLNSAPSAPLSDSLLSHLAFISPNEHEAEDLTGIPIRREGDHVNLEDARAAAEALREKGVQNVLITLGSGGAVLLGPDGFVHSPCVEGITAVDPTAAGDSFVGAFCVGTCCGWTNQELLQFANHTAALTVSAMGAMPSLPSLEKVERFMAQKNILLPDISVLK